LVDEDHLISKDIVSLILNLVGLTDFQQLYPKQLSGGMRTRASLARTMITFPKLLLLDEPFSSLDINWKTHLYNDLFNLSEVSNSAFVIVTHDIIEALTLSNNIVIIGEKGNMIKHIQIKEALPRNVAETIHLLNDKYMEIYHTILDEKIRL
jgi:ABC-type nitrate/sulfonate/bicarbonate transport system ATPase subunit